MSAQLVILAEAIKDLVNTPAALTPAPNATREYQPFYDLDKLTTAKVLVVGTSDRTIERCDRGAWKHELTVEILLQQKLDDDANGPKDALVLQADGICEYVKGNWDEASSFELAGASVQPTVQPDIFKQNKLFTTAARLTFWQYR
jgi:hypothetical protein